MIGKGVRHSDVRTHFFQDAFLQDIVQPGWRPTNDLLADFPILVDKGPGVRMVFPIFVPYPLPW